MFRGPLLMQQGASLTRALSLFRQMGLHHILIAPPDPRAIGFVTRRVSQPNDEPSMMCRPDTRGGGLRLSSAGVSSMTIINFLDQAVPPFNSKTA